MGSAKDDFIELIMDINKLRGLDELSSKIIGILYATPKEISLEKLAQETGYSLSAVSTSMKLFASSGFVKRIKKPGSKKVYFFMEKDMISMFTEIMKNSEVILLLAKSRMPAIIEKYQRSKSSPDELKIVKDYYRQVATMEKVMKKFSDMLEDAK